MNQSKTAIAANPLYSAGNAPSAAMIGIVDVTGKRFAVARHLVTTSSFTPKDEFEFHFGSSSVRVKGKRLLPVYQSLVEQRLLEIRVGDPLNGDEIHCETWIDSVEVIRD